MQPNERVRGIPLSKTIALDTRAKELIAAGRDVVNMSAGEPDFDAPEAVRAAARTAVDGGDVRYTPAPGRASLRQAVAEHLGATRGVPYEGKEVVICHSAKHALSGAILTLTEPGDEVLLLLPAWVSYFEQVRYAGGVPVAVEPREDMGPDLERLRAAITPRTRGILINSPCNPSGYVLTEAETRAIAALAREHDLWIVSDEIYRRLVYEGEAFFSPVQIDADARARTLIVDGASKTYAMTGYRIGFVAGPAEVVGAIGRLHSQLTGSPNAIAQDAYEVALRNEPEEIPGRVAEFAARRRVVVEGLEAIGLRVPEGRGTFYVFPDVRPWLDERGTDGFCEDLLEQEGLAIVPGSAFGLDGYVRLSYATSVAKIRDAVERLGRFVAGRPRTDAVGSGRA